MAKILLIETSTALCSVALSVDGNIVSSRKSGLDRKHASLTAVFCDEVLREAGLKAADLDAVCISDGPGSYTGLRVGLSTAKGLCFGADVKLLSVSSLDVLAAMALERNSVAMSVDGLCLHGAEAPLLGPQASTCLLQAPSRPQDRSRGRGPREAWEGSDASQPGPAMGVVEQWSSSAIVPMIDARRMEVYTANYNAEGMRVSEIEARIIEDGAYAEMPENTIFIGDGALKCREAIGKGIFVEAYPDAASMGMLAEKEYAAGNFRDVAYFEPFYLKEFVATTSKKKLF